MDERDKYAKAILSAQISIDYEGVPCHVVVWDPELAATHPGYTWAGGYFFPSGNMKADVDRAQHLDSGVILEEDSLQLKRIVYSRTKKHGHWIANHTFAAKARPVEEWGKPQFDDLSVALVDTRSLSGRPQIVKTIYGKEYEFDWAINDGPCISESVFKEFIYNSKGRSFLPEIPVVNVPVSEKSTMPCGFGLTVGNVILPHTYKGKHGYVCIRNHDSSHYALIGGKVGSLEDIGSRNIDVRSGIMQESSEEIGVSLYGTSIIGCALTPWDSVVPGDRGKGVEGKRNSIITTSIHARPVNPKELDHAIENPNSYIKESNKIKGLYFLPDDDFYHIVNLGLMRTPDMAPLARQCLIGTHRDRPNLESIVLANMGLDFVPTTNEPLLPETRYFKE